MPGNQKKEKNIRMMNFYSNLKRSGGLTFFYLVSIFRPRANLSIRRIKKFENFPTLNINFSWLYRNWKMNIRQKLHEYQKKISTGSNVCA